MNSEQETQAGIRLKILSEVIRLKCHKQEGRTDWEEIGQAVQTLYEVVTGEKRDE